MIEWSWGWKRSEKNVTAVEHRWTLRTQHKPEQEDHKQCVDHICCYAQGATAPPAKMVQEVKGPAIAFQARSTAIRRDISGPHRHWAHVLRLCVCTPRRRASLWWRLRRRPWRVSRAREGIRASGGGGHDAGMLWDLWRCDPLMSSLKRMRVQEKKESASEKSSPPPSFHPRASIPGGLPGMQRDSPSFHPPTTRFMRCPPRSLTRSPNLSRSQTQIL